MRIITFLIFALLLTNLGIYATPASHSPEGVLWRYPGLKRTIFIGDIHGDYRAMLRILHGLGIIDYSLNWHPKATETAVVLTGDLNDRGPHTREIMDLLMKIQPQAGLRGSRLHVIFGNHHIDLVRQGVTGTTIEEARGFQSLRGFDVKVWNPDIMENPHLHKIVSAFSHPESPYARWLASHNTVIDVGHGILVVHGSLTPEMIKLGMGNLNDHIRSWMRYFQQKSINPHLEPPESLKPLNWLLGEQGPLLNRHLYNQVFTSNTLSKMLKDLGMSKIVIGHTPTNSGNIEFLMNGRVINVDTSITAVRGGYLTALVIEDGKTMPLVFPRDPDYELSKQKIKEHMICGDMFSKFRVKRWSY